jgi:ABC-type uncharacterized transport system ATPase subunit
VSLEVARGELLAIVGENGAGKSSLMNVLYGLYRPDSGEIHLRGAPVSLRGPRDAIRLGIGMVHQHFMLVPALTVAENVVLGREPRRCGLLDLQRAADEVSETARRLGFSLDPRARVEDLGVGARQKAEIVKALHRGAEALILDEPTAVLTPQEAEALHQVARQLAAGGRSVIFISHKLREVLSVAERIAVMRRGRKVAEVLARDASVESLAESMVGGEIARRAPSAVGARASDVSSAPERSRTERAHGTEPPAAVLEVRDLSTPPGPSRVALSHLSLEIRGGEIVGIAGVDGNGQRDLVEVLTGLRAATGSVRVAGREVLGLDPGEVRAIGVGHVSEDRLLRAIVGAMTVEENLALGRHRSPPFARGVLIDFRGRRARAEALLESYDVRPRDPSLPARELSGGNQQKVVLARELDARPPLLIAAQPTRGLDVAAVAAIHDRLRAHRESGAAVLLVSLDLEELLALSDRLCVLFGGRVIGQVERADFDERRIGRWMLGGGEAARA